MKAACVHEYGKRPVLEDVPVPDSQPDEILVLVAACGMCGSDVQLVDGYFRKYADIPTPITLGHEITGVVHKISGVVPKSSGLREGDVVVVAPGCGDGTCRHCQIGGTQICPNVRWPGFGRFGGFAEFIPVPARYLIKVDSPLKFEELAPLTDAGLTPYRGVKKLRDAGALGPNRVLGIFGVGGLGGYAVQYAELLGGGATVVTFARNPDKLAIAKEYGADHLISIKGKSAADIGRELSKATGQDELENAPARPRMRLQLPRPAPRASRIESLTNDGANGRRMTPHLSSSDGDVVGGRTPPCQSRLVTHALSLGWGVAAVVSMLTRHGVVRAWASRRRDATSASEAASDNYPRARCRRRAGAVIPMEPATMRDRSWSIMRCGLALAAGLLLLAQSPVAAQQMQMMPPGQVELIRGLLPSVVNITSFVIEPSPTAGMNVGSASGDQAASHPKEVRGSGFIIDPSGVILTNYHVIDGANDVHVKLSDGTVVSGRIIATAARIDLALVKVDTQHPLTVVHWGDSDKVQIGDPVFAIGNALGIGLSVTSGIVSALNRNIMDTPFDDFIQTDAAINHGNSGGPLFNRQGEVIGVDTAIISPTTGSVGLGFAIPANDAYFVSARLLREGQIVLPSLGVKVEEVTPDMAAALDMKQALGSIVAVLHEGGPAATAGVEVGDIILRFNNQTPADERALLRDIAKAMVGETVPVTFLRDGHEHTVQVKLIAWPAMRGSSDAVAGRTRKPVMLVPANLGLSLSALTTDLGAHYGLKMHQAGVLIDGVAAGTDASERGLVTGDVILRMQDKDVASPQEVQAAVEAARAQQRAFVLALVLPKTEQPTPGPRWMALRVAEGVQTEGP
jgi:propanol-preferring alcohol dehydrogenase